jgi:hypothetical protein
MGYSKEMFAEVRATSSYENYEVSRMKAVDSYHEFKAKGNDYDDEKPNPQKLKCWRIGSEVKRGVWMSYTNQAFSELKTASIVCDKYNKKKQLNLKPFPIFEHTVFAKEVFFEA